MKFRLFVFASLAVLFAGCTREGLPEIIEKGEQIVTISATIPQDTDTRVSYDDGTRKLAWQTGDQLLLAGYDGATYKGNSTFTYITDSGNQFTGTTVAGATTYKAYYPASSVSLDADGNLQAFSPDFWQQTQNGNGSTEHLRNKLFLTDETPKAVDASFSLALKSSILKFDLSNISSEIGTPTKLIWTVEATDAHETRSMMLNLSGVSSGATTLTAYLAFDPSVMKLAAGGEFKITVIGDKSYEWSTTSSAGKDYAAGNRYTAATGGAWTQVAPLIYTIKTSADAETHTVWMYPYAFTCPAELTIDWGDGNTITIPQDAWLEDNTIAMHTYAAAGDYTVTIYSAQTSVSQIQMPPISFSNGVTNGQLMAVLTPFPNMGAAASFDNCFEGCSGLSSIPSDLFKYNTGATSFFSCFSGCIGLSSIPSDLFRYNTEATSFFYCFSGCSGLSSIPSDLFRYNTEVTDFSSCFSGCSGLSSIPSDLFLYNTGVTSFASCFEDCSGLSSIPLDLFRYNTAAANFNYCFSGCSGLSSIPSDLFRYNTGATSFFFCFSGCSGLSSIPSDLFRYNTGVTSFGSCFQLCSGLSSIPSDLFRYNTAATDFSSCFFYCTKLQLASNIFPDPDTNASFFDGRTMNFTTCFCNVGTSATQGTAPELWKFNGSSSWTVEDCFTGANVSNYGVIPNSWKGL